MSLFGDEPYEARSGIAHCFGKNDKRCESKFEHRVGTQITFGVDVSDVEYLGRDHEQDGYDEHAADKHVSDVSRAEKLLYWIGPAVSVHIFDRYFLIAVCGGALFGTGKLIVFCKRNPNEEYKANGDVRSPEYEQLIRI